MEKSNVKHEMSASEPVVDSRQRQWEKLGKIRGGHTYWRLYKSDELAIRSEEDGVLWLDTLRPLGVDFGGSQRRGDSLRVHIPVLVEEYDSDTGVVSKIPRWTLDALDAIPFVVPYWAHDEGGIRVTGVGKKALELLNAYATVWDKE